LKTKLGREAEARKLVSAKEQEPAKVGRRTLAFRSYVALGDREKFSAAIEENFERRSVATNLKVDPTLDPVRGYARSRAASKRTGL
jgi:hypothetical protein